MHIHVCYVIKHIYIYIYIYRQNIANIASQQKMTSKAPVPTGWKNRAPVPVAHLRLPVANPQGLTHGNTCHLCKIPGFGMLCRKQSPNKTRRSFRIFLSNWIMFTTVLKMTRMIETARPWKMVGGSLRSFFGRPILRGYVSFRERYI